MEWMARGIRSTKRDPICLCLSHLLRTLSFGSLKTKVRKKHDFCYRCLRCSFSLEQVWSLELTIVDQCFSTSSSRWHHKFYFYLISFSFPPETFFCAAILSEIFHFKCHFYPMQMSANCGSVMDSNRSSCGSKQRLKYPKSGPTTMKPSLVSVTQFVVYIIESFKKQLPKWTTMQML